MKILKFALLLFFSVTTYYSVAQQDDLDSTLITQKLNVFDTTFHHEKVYLHTDRTFYKPGDDVWYAAFLVNGKDHKDYIQSNILYVELFDPKGNMIKMNRMLIAGILNSGEFHLPTNMPGGLYKIKAYTHLMLNFGEEVVFEKTIRVQSVVYPDLLLKLDFLREAYGSGEQVTAEFNAKSLDNKPLVNHEFSYSISLSGEQIKTSLATTDAKGDAIVQFTLPNALKSNDGILNIIAEYGGLTESISRSIPIVLNDIDLQFFPEGGEMLSGVKGKLAFKALNEFGQAADIRGAVYNEQDEIISTFDSYHMGMGTFAFTPEKGKNYYAKITNPKGINKKYELPEAKDLEYGIQLVKNSKEEVVLKVYSPEAEKVTLVGQIRGQIYYQKTITADKNGTAVRIPSRELPKGIGQFTLFDMLNRPHSERLVFVNYHKKLNIELKANKEKYLPREKVSMEITVTDEFGNPVQGDFAMSVTNGKVIKLADDKQDNIESYFLMSSDLKGDIEEPNFYFDPEEKKAEKALDLVMLTHGWRKFKWKEIMALTPLDWLGLRTYEMAENCIAGQLKLGSKIIPNTKVKIKGTQRETTTDSLGYFTFCNVPWDNMTVTARYKVKKMQYEFKTLSNKNDQLLDPDVHYLNSSNTAGKGCVKGVVKDEATRELIPFANVTLLQNDVPVAGASTDFDGRYKINPIEPGIYDLKISYVGYRSVVIKGVRIRVDKVLDYNIRLQESTMNIMGATVIQFNQPLIDFDGGMIRQTIQRMPLRTAGGIARATGGVVASSGFSVRGGRSDATIYYIDGIKVRGTANLPKAAMEEVTVMLGGLPASYGAGSIEVVAFRQPLIDMDAGATRVSFSRMALRSVSGRDASGVGAGVVGRRGGVSYERGADSDIDYLRGSSLIFYGARGGGSNSYGNNYGYYNSYRHYSPQLKVLPINTNQPFYREKEFYHPKYDPKTNIKKKEDRRETIYWNPKIKTDEQGKSNVNFYNSDETTTFRATIEGVTTGGEIGRNELSYAVQPLVDLDVKLPRQLSFGDVIKIPVVIRNNTDSEITTTITALLTNGLKQHSQLDSTVTLPLNGIEKRYLKCEVLQVVQKQQVKIAVSSRKYKDSFSGEITIQPKGFPREEYVAGNEIEGILEVNLDDVVKGSVKAEFIAYTSMLDNLMSAVAGIMREPYGCFEQVSSSNYPNIMALKFMETTGTVDHQTRSRAISYLKSGYKKLAAYETSQKGFEWYGKTPPHEGLTAYGLLQFHEMKTVIDIVDESMVNRTKKWLLARRDGKGGWKQNRGKYGFSNANYNVSNAYILYALTETNVQNLEKEIATAYKEAKSSRDAYRLGLMANVFFNIDDDERGQELLNIMWKDLNRNDQKFKAEHSITYSWGTSLEIECRSLMLMAALKSKESDIRLIEESVKYILSKQNRGKFGSTQSTVMALKSLMNYSLEFQKSAEGGQIEIYVNGNKVATKQYAAKGMKAIKVDSLEQYLQDGKSTLAVRFLGVEKAIPWSMNVSWATQTPENNNNCKIALQTSLKGDSTKVGEVVRMTTTVRNITTKGLPSPMVVLGIPSGLSPQMWQLEELIEKEMVDFFEIFGDRLVLYYREMGPSEEKVINLDLKADIPGLYRAPASSAYLYYMPEEKSWTGSKEISVMQ